MLEFLWTVFFWVTAILLFLVTCLLKRYFPICVCFFWLLISTSLFIIADYQYYAGRNFTEEHSVTVRGTIADYGCHRYFHRNYTSEPYCEGAIYYHDKKGNKYSIELPASGSRYRYASDAIVVYNVEYPEKAMLISLNGKPQYIYTQTGSEFALWARLCLFLALIALFSIYWRESCKRDKQPYDPLWRDRDKPISRANVSRRRK